MIVAMDSRDFISHVLFYGSVALRADGRHLDLAGKRRRCREIGANPIFENAFRIQFHLVSVFEWISRARFRRRIARFDARTFSHAETGREVQRLRGALAIRLGPNPGLVENHFVGFFEKPL